MKKLYIGNLPWQASENELKELFGAVGEVASVAIITDRDTGRSRGFAFIEMEEADKAIEKFNGYDMGGRPLRVNEAMDKPGRR